MQRSWANSGLDLHIDLDRGRLRESLEHGLREAIRGGRLPAGTLLPPSRALALDLGIARNTVAEAYAQLVAEGWLTARQGSGTRVSEHVAGAAAAVTSAPWERWPAKYDLRPGYPDLSLFPRGDWLTAARIALNKAPAAALGYGDPRGRPELRTALAGYLGRARGVNVSPDNIVVCSGYQQGLWLLATALQRRGARTIGVESYGLRGHQDVLTDAGLRPAWLPVDDDGAEPVELERLDAVLLTPAHQFPIGVALAAARRNHFVQWAARTGGVVIEDDYDGEFRYDRRAVGALQALAPEHVVYAGTASKTLAPGLRLAWLALPSHLVADVVERHQLVAVHSATLDQLTLAEFIDSGRYDRHLRRCRQVYRLRRDRFAAAMAKRVPGAAVSGLPAGLHAVLRLPAGHTEADAIERARERGLALEGLGSYTRRAGGQSPALVVGYATPPAHAFTGALARLSATLS